MTISNSKVCDIASALQLTTRRVQQLVQAGILPKPISSNYDLVQCIKSYEQYSKDNQLTDKSTGNSLNEQRVRLLKAQAEKAEFELDVLKGKYLENSEVEFSWSNLIIAFRSKLLSMPSKLVRSLAAANGDFAKIEQILEDEIHDALQELSRSGEDEEYYDSHQEQIITSSEA